MTRRRTPHARRNGDDRRHTDRRVVAWAPVPAERRQAERRVQTYRRSGWDRRGVAERRRRATSW